MANHILGSLHLSVQVRFLLSIPHDILLFSENPTKSAFAGNGIQVQVRGILTAIRLNPFSITQNY